MYKDKQTASDKRKEKHIKKIFDDINTLFDVDEDFASDFKTQKIFTLLMLVSEKTLEHNARFGEYEVSKYKEALERKKQMPFYKKA